jgi:hypothetical protein
MSLPVLAIGPAIGLATGLLGGLLVGLAAAALLVLRGRVAGVSGLVGVALTERPRDGVAIPFLLGLVASGFVAWILAPATVHYDLARPLPVLAVAGFLVGIGTRLGGGCTSGHGVCGVGRGSLRSIVATSTFIAVGMLTVAGLRLFGVAW